MIPERYQNIYQFNPVAALVLALRNILIEGTAPPDSLLYRLFISSFAMLAVGSVAFGRMKQRFYDHL